MDATYQGGRNEYRQQYQHHPDNRPRDFAHRHFRYLPHIHLLTFCFSLIQQTRDILHHHNGIIHHNGNGQYQAEQSQRIDGETQECHHRQGTYQRYGNGDARNQDRPPTLQEEEHHQHHEDSRLDEGLHHFVDGIVYHFRRVERHLIADALRKSFGQFRHPFLHAFRHIERIGTGKLIDGNTRRRFALQTGNHIVFLTSEFNPCHILQPENPSAILHPKNDFTELIGCSQATFHIQGILKSIVTRTTERLADIPCRHLHILCLNSGIHLLGTEVTDTHRLGVEPNTHRIVTGTHHIHRTHSRHTGQLVHQIQVGIVGEIQTIVNAIARQGEHHHDVRRFLLHRHPLLLHRLGEGVQSHTHAVLHHHGRHIDVRSHLEGYGQRISTRCRRSGAHIHHSFHPVHLLFDGDTHGLCHGLRIRSRIDGIHLNRWWSDVGILLDGEHTECH